MIIRTLRKVSIEVSSFVLFFLLAFGSQSASIARECTCRNIGAGICVPDPLCLNMLSDVIEKAAQSHGKEINATVLNTGKTIEKAAQDTGKAIEKATQHTGMTIGKAAHDTGKTVEKSSAEVGNALAKQRIDLKNAILNQAADVEETVDWYGKAIANTVVTDKAIGRVRILETGYSVLQELGKEESGYGLYSYAVMGSDSIRSTAFLSQVFQSIPDVENTAADRAQINILYVPLKKDKVQEFADAIKVAFTDRNYGKLGTKYSQSMYDYKMARAMLDHICNPPAAPVREVCSGDMSRGPYIFTYVKPASSLEPVPPPFLLVDLSEVHQQAFGEFVSAFKAQVKREDVTDRARINSLRLKLLNIVLKASDWVSPIQKSIADIVHSEGGKEAK